MDSIYIVSGEGEVGTRERYHGKRTMRALRMRLTRERCGGDRFARAEYGSGEPIYTDDGSAGSTKI